MRDLLKRAAVLVFDTANDQLQQGGVPLFLGVDGHLALMFDAIRRYSTTRDQDELVRLAASSLFVVAKAIEHEARLQEAQRRAEPEPEPEPEQQDIDISDADVQTAIEPEVMQGPEDVNVIATIE